MEYICEVNSEQEIENLLQSISRLTLPEILGVKFKVFCDLDYSRIQEKLDKKNIDNNFYKVSDLNRILSGLNGSEVVVWLSGQVILEPEQIENLRNHLVSNLNAGLLSGLYSKELLVDDIYSPSKLREIDRKGFIPVDVVDSSLFVCRGEVLKELSFDKRYFGLSLRQIGYQNYIDTNIRLNKENKNAENNNAESFARKR